MAAISLALTRGKDGFKISDFAVGTAAPTAGQDVELRFNTTDQNSVAMTRFEVIKLAKAMIRAMETGGSNVNIFGGTMI
jgi:hypothetical protein